ncbi:MAG: hypothetical protein A2794_00135 [Alphaproteobacteria bacterium RIFCSPHIGHO2_01_FULL_40_8]|nr:MAG: hypothetical protein A2794_00135 [Alphaproteobacteria bacterium RIFCSPHIGHO2_01_FULL_40_8]
MKLPILLYHDIKEDNFNIEAVDPGLRPYILRESDFRKQVEWLRNNAKVAIVFDDGWKSNYEIARPILKQYGLTAIFFVTIENIGKPEMMTWSQLREMADNDMIIGSHSMTHRPPIEFSDTELKYELSESKRILEENLGKKIDSFSAPTGFYDKRIIDIAREVGYKEVYFSRIAFSEVDSLANPLVLYKIGIKRDCDFKIFKAIVRGDKLVLAKLRSGQLVRDWAKSVFGVQRYEGLKRLALRHEG